VAEWVERAMEETADGTPARIRALIAQSAAKDDENAARAAVVMAERLGDPNLRFQALDSLEFILRDLGNFAEAGDVASRRNALLPLIPDPDRIADALFADFHLSVATGRVNEARDKAQQMEGVAAGLTPHHRVHSLGLRMSLESAIGDWAALRSVTQPAEATIAANLATPCPFNRGLLILLATAWTRGGDDAQAERLLRRAEDVGMASYTMVHTPRWLALAIARHDRAETRRLIDSVEPRWLSRGSWELWSLLFDALAEVDDGLRIEAEAPEWLGANLYVTAFATRALAMARRDSALLEEAAARFAAMGLDLRVAETRAMGERLAADA
jgi:hypothetical protein